MLEIIAFDADDTLWHSETYYAEAQARFVEILSPYGETSEQALAVLHRVEIENLPYFGYGFKGFTLSMVQAALSITAGAVRGEHIQELIDLGKTMSGHAVLLLDGVHETVAQLARHHPLMLITKGDLLDQERKISDSGLGDYFQYIEIVSDKTPASYQRLFQRHDINPARFLMIGNSLRSDIAPVLSLGGYAVHVPYHLTWAHEALTDLPAADGRFFQLESITDLPRLIGKIEKEGASGNEERK
jgi:putative hydrolase of the HAD superfamily